MTQVEAYVSKWVNYLNAVDHEMSLIAARKLGRVQDGRAVNELVKALKGRPDDIRTAAARSLGDIGNPMAVPALTRLLNDANSVVASTAAESLGKIGDTSAVPALVKVLEDYKSDRTPRHRQIHGFDRGLYAAAVLALQKINNFPARKALAKYHR